MRPLFVLSMLALAAAQPARADVSATLSLSAPDTLSVRYEIPASCQALTFVNAGISPQSAAAMRAGWRASDGCSTVDARGVQRQQPGCKALQLTVPVSDLKLDRVYPWAFPMGGAVYAHTSAFEVGASCGPVSWTFAAPAGMVVFNGLPSFGSAAAHEVVSLPVIFVERPLAGGVAARSYVDPRLTPAAAALASDTVQRAFDLYARIMPGLDAAHGFVAITSSPDPRSFGGDVAAHTTMRLTLPASIPAAMERNVQGYVAHEVAHMHQPPSWHDSWRGDQPMIAEGGAELLRWIALSQLAWADDAYLKQYLEHAFNSCVMAADGKRWSEIAERTRGQAPYDCGLAFHALGLATRTAAAPAMLVLRDYYLAGRRGEATDFATALECGAKAGCSARWLNRIAGAEPVAAVFGDYARADGFLKVAGPAAIGVVEPVMRDVVAQLMRIDCHGQTSIYQDPGAARIGPVGHCDRLREGMVIVAAQGQPLFAGPAVVKAVLAACAGRGAASLGLQDGSAVALRCSGTDVRAPAELFEVDLGRLRKLLGA